MAARMPAAPETIDLRRLSARDLEPLLAEETEEWLETLEWDFTKSAGLVRRFVDMRALNGAALVEGGEVTGYLYYVLEEAKGLIGDLYVRRAWRTPEREDLLLGAALASMTAGRRITRVEAQLLMMQAKPCQELRHAARAVCFERNYMRIDLGRAPLDEGRVRRPMFLERWSDHHQDAAARLIAAAYTGHIDSRINDQYQTVAGARRFLYNIVQYPGCGTFFRPASWVAMDAAMGDACGISLTSLVAPSCGHVTQICVAPEVRSTGIGHALLRRSLMSLRDSGCASATLTVTAANTSAVELYERMGFRTVRRFPAYVWEPPIYLWEGL